MRFAFSNGVDIYWLGFAPDIPGESIGIFGSVILAVSGHSERSLLAVSMSGQAVFANC